jgi:hypothetical protein
MRLPVQATPVLRGNGFQASRYRARQAVVPQDECSVCVDTLAGAIYATANADCWLGCSTISTIVSSACSVAFDAVDVPWGGIVCSGIANEWGQICNLIGCDGLQTWSGATNAASIVCKAEGIC